MRPLVAATALGTTVAAPGGAEAPGPRAAVTAVHLFEWDWPDVARECETFLGPKGFDGVQISPPTEHIEGPQWWTRYQPVSYKIISRSGDEAEFKDMVQRCNAAGIMVIVDAVINHMALNGTRGVAGSTYGNRTYEAVPYTQADFHHLPGDPARNCFCENDEDFHNITSVQRCDLTELPDLCTECPRTRARIVELLRKIVAFGSNIGFRIDAAKSIAAPDFERLIVEAGSPWQYGEVHSGAEDPAPLQPSAYLRAGHVTEFEFSVQVGQIFNETGQLSELKGVGIASGLVPSDKAVIFIENHDTMRAGCMSCAPVKHTDGDKFYLANVFMLAWPYGYPLVMSSYEFPRGDHDGGPPGYPVVCGIGWNCEHRRPEIANMVGWRRTAGNAPVKDFVVARDDPGNRVYFNRGGLAFVALNRGEKEAWLEWMQTGLQPGSYCDVIQSDDLASCPQVEVDASGFAWIRVEPVKAVALHADRRLGVERHLQPAHMGAPFVAGDNLNAEVWLPVWLLLVAGFLCSVPVLMYAMGYCEEGSWRRRRRKPKSRVPSGDEDGEAGDVFTTCPSNQKATERASFLQRPVGEDLVGIPTSGAKAEHLPCGVFACMTTRVVSLAPHCVATPLLVRSRGGATTALVAAPLVAGGVAAVAVLPSSQGPPSMAQKLASVGSSIQVLQQSAAPGPLQAWVPPPAKPTWSTV